MAYRKREAPFTIPSAAHLSVPLPPGFHQPRLSVCAHAYSADSFTSASSVFFIKTQKEENVNSVLRENLSDRTKNLSGCANCFLGK